jgi:hypothetical protein
MYREDYAESRDVREIRHNPDLCIIGGGLAGTCAAITAAREGVEVVLIQDRPVLGGNSSSEVRLWALGATAHMNNNNRFSREGGVIDEILVENVRRNKEGNPLIYDTIVLEKATEEDNITLLLNTVMYRAEMSESGDRVYGVRAYNPQTETRHLVHAPLFVDASGDGVLAYMAGAPYRFGAESSTEFGEQFAPSPDEYGELLGHSIFFYTKDVGDPVKFRAPSYAIPDAPNRIPRFKNFNVNDNGCKFWWIEYGGRLDTIHDTEQIKWELWKVIYGVWDYIKNSGQYPEAETLTLEWVGAIPGKRESRRFEGDVMMVQDDIVEQRSWYDAVSFGGWSLDLHPADGVYSAREGCDQYHAKGVYQIPYRAMYAPSIPNLFLTGRIISTSHVAFGSTRVMCTCAHNAQAVGMAAVMCRDRGIEPREVAEKAKMAELQRRLIRRGQYIPFMPLEEPENLARQAELSASSAYSLSELWDHPSIASTEAANGSEDDAASGFIQLDRDTGVLLPLPAGNVPTVEVHVDVAEAGERYVMPMEDEEPQGAHSAHRAATEAPKEDEKGRAVLHVELRVSEKPGNFTPENTVAACSVGLSAGDAQAVSLPFEGTLDQDQYAVLVFSPHPRVRLRAAATRVPGVRLLRHTHDQADPGTIGVDGFELWLPERRPGGLLPQLRLDPDPTLFPARDVANGYQRPYLRVNAWAPSLSDPDPELRLEWTEPRRIRQVEIVFDTDADHAMETVLRGHADSEMPYCTKRYQLLDESGRILHEESENYHTLRWHRFETPVRTRVLRLRVLETWGASPGAIYDLRCYEA